MNITPKIPKITVELIQCSRMRCCGACSFLERISLSFRSWFSRVTISTVPLQILLFHALSFYWKQKTMMGSPPLSREIRTFTKLNKSAGFSALPTITRRKNYIETQNYISDQFRSLLFSSHTRCCNSPRQSFRTSLRSKAFNIPYPMLLRSEMENWA